MHTAFVMKKLALCTLIAALVWCAPTPAVYAASDSTTILISELQTGGTTDATAEFIELYNPADTTVDVTGWQLQYRPASGTPDQSWAASTTKATIACIDTANNCRVTLSARGRLVLAHAMSAIDGALPMSGGFSDKGGEIRLIATDGTMQDMVGYGTAATSEGSAAAAPSAGHSLKRKMSQDGSLIATNNNSNDFVADCGDPTPGRADTGTLPLAEGCYIPSNTTGSTGSGTDSSDNSATTATGDSTSQSTDTTQQDQTSYAALLITELLPDPAAPQQDATDEFIELYNPNDTSVHLSGYQLQAGSDYRYTYTLGDTLLGPHAYVAIPSADSHVSLSNSGSGVRLLDPANSVVYEVPNYGAAKEGQSWMLDDTGWHWSLTPTPGAANLLTLPAPKPTATTVSATKKVTAASITKAATKKAAVLKVPAAKKAVAKPKQPSSFQGTASATTSPQQYWLLLPIGALVTGYAVYEYRHSISRAIQKCWYAVASGKKGEQLPNSEEAERLLSG